MNKLIISIILGFLFSIIFGPIYIPMLKKLKAGQAIREEGPKSHLVKSGTPTIGGVIFLTSLLLSNILLRNFSMIVIMLLISTLGFAAIGFIDDYIKVIKKRNLGLTAIQKLLLQIFMAILIIVFQYIENSYSSNIFIPVIKREIALGILYIPFIIFVVVGTVNSVNLTDGLDGLSSSITILVLIFLAIVGIKSNKPEISIFALSLSGALIGFFIFNKYPAKIFMGDTGSLALGGAVSAIAVLLNIPLLLPIVGGIYFIETLSVIIQVISFKTRKKRVFLMSPIHHHFEHKGWSEKKIVFIFCVIEIFLLILSYFMIF